MSGRAAQVKRRGAAVIALCREIDEPLTERSFMIVECGLHSGFPHCCIAFFVKAYEPIVMTEIKMRAPTETIAQLIKRVAPSHAKALRALGSYRGQAARIAPRLGYVACPQCLDDQNFVKVKRCDWHLTARGRRRILTDVCEP